ncbi:class I SAM-dependent methyltransferase [Octadecabacter sp. G9-8]|uniref:Class I SAM-dependent methyltransferase n=1 Tax=Octadecabacter dasysiphoniae TaxID=2909341 RepID=A0ABS9D1D0_9RHOB|nr:class I SAM-dependent methyltransferase [Octadecabacter dasysiphoniae]MCF2872445.1 class I SAM-dependent methyltransferase [Octadecabacter dasysiphoniae]
MKTRRHIKRSIRTNFAERWTTFLDFPMYAANSTGPSKFPRDLTLQGINDIVPRFADLAALSSGQTVQHVNVESFIKDEATRARSEILGNMLTEHGSEKARKHNYHLLLAHALQAPEKASAILEIGMGTNNTDVVSHMGKRGQPGASLRAFREFLPNAHVYGADYDKRILFTEDRISTFFVDQTSVETLTDLATHLPAQLDLIIDDGLHSAHANLATLAFALPKLAKGGWYICEDIHAAAIPVWEAATHMISTDFTPYIVQTAGAIVFAVHHKG